MFPHQTAIVEAALDDLLEPCFEADQPFDWWRSGRDEWWARLAAACVTDVLDVSPVLRSLARSHRSGPGRVDGPAGDYRDLLVPSAIFKRGLTVSEAKDVVGCSSSGTRGSVSSVPRDDATLQRFFSGVRAVVRAIVDMGTSGFSVVSLVPSLSTPRAPWTSYIVAGMAASHPMVEPGDTDPVAVLTTAAQANDRVLLVGAPYEVLRFAEAARATGVWSDRLIIATVGGWKTSEREAIAPRELRRQVSTLLGVDPKDIRDAYSMVEINSVLVECSEHRKHIPPWLEVLAMSPRHFEPVAPGAEGMLAFFDPSATSFPGFILSEDVGTRHEDACGCGLPGPTLTGVRRLTRVEARGCALASAPKRAVGLPVPQLV